MSKSATRGIENFRSDIRRLSRKGWSSHVSSEDRVRIVRRGAP